jgi:hypothetical protein
VSGSVAPLHLMPTMFACGTPTLDDVNGWHGSIRKIVHANALRLRETFDIYVSAFAFRTIDLIHNGLH